LPTLKNTTQKPISVPLPRGKRLFLGPGKTGQVAPKAADHPPIVALIESGDLEIVSEGKGHGHDRKGGSSGASDQSANLDKSVFRSGDR